MKVVLVTLFACALGVGFAYDEDEFIAEINAKAKGQWVAGKSGFGNRKPALGVWNDSHIPKRYRTEYPKGMVLSESFDAREKWPQCKSIGMVWDQADCSSDWAVAAAAAISDRMCIHRDMKKLVSPSAIMSCCTSCGKGCDGGYSMKAWEFWETEGVVSGGLYGDNSTCTPYALPKCEHYTQGKYPPCNDEAAETPKCKNIYFIQH